MALQLAMKLLSPLVVGMAEKGGLWLSKVGKQRLTKWLETLPYMTELQAALDNFVALLDHEVAAKQEFKEILAGTRPRHDSTFSKFLTPDLQAHIKELGAVDDLGAEMAARFDAIENLLNPQPPLHLRMFAETAENRFFYGARAVPFFGRAEELEALSGFLEGERPFSSWLLAGPGGAGKSRLALEFCLSCGGAWRLGFLRSESSFSNWDTWQPERPTLMIVDYDLEFPERLGNCLTSAKVGPVLGAC